MPEAKICGTHGGMRRLTGCAEGTGKVLAAEQAPSDDDEGGQRNPEDHAENAPEGGAPKKRSIR